MCCCINSVNAGEASMTRRRVHGKHLGLRGDSGYRGFPTVSLESRYRSSSTAFSCEVVGETDQVNEESKHQGPKVSNARLFIHMWSLVTTHQDVTCASFFSTMQVPSEPAGEGSGPPREPDSAAVKGEYKVKSGGQRWAESIVHPPPPKVLRLLWLICAGSLLASSHSRLAQKEGSCLWSAQLVPWEGGKKEEPSS